MHLIFSLTSVLPPSLPPSHPGYFGKVGMRHYHLTRQKYFCPIVNIDRLWSLVPEATRQQFKDRKDGKVPVLDVVQHVSL